MIDEIKEKGRAGLNYAFDTNGAYVAASNAIPGMKYYCPYCRCDMHLTTSPTGKKYYARNAKSSHLMKECITIERKGVEKTFDKLDPQKFIASLCYATSRTAAEKDEIKNFAPKAESTYQSSTEFIEEYGKVSSFGSLKQIAESGIHMLRSNDIQGQHRISEFILTFKFAFQFFRNPSFELGARILYARFKRVSPDNSIFFDIFNGNDHVHLRLFFPHRHDFVKYRDRFGAYKLDEQTGKTVFISAHNAQDVLIACDNWIKMNRSQCEQSCPRGYNRDCRNCYGVYQANYSSSKQIYLLPAD